MIKSFAIDFASTLGGLVAGLLLCALFLAIVRHLAFHQRQKSFHREIKPQYEEHG